MMKVEIDINDKYAIRDIWVFAGMEPVARKYKHNGYWEIKVSECSRCGECCKQIRESHPLGTENGCKHLLDQGSEYLCEMAYYRPFGCAVGELPLDSCTVKWEKIK